MLYINKFCFTPSCIKNIPKMYRQVKKNQLVLSWSRFESDIEMSSFSMSFHGSLLLAMVRLNVLDIIRSCILSDSSSAFSDFFARSFNLLVRASANFLQSDIWTVYYLISMKMYILINKKIKLEYGTDKKSTAAVTHASQVTVAKCTNL